MCIAILKPKGKKLSKDTLQTCYDNNKDGCGFAFVKDNQVKIFKFNDFEKFYGMYKQIQENDYSNMLIHFRIATHGGVNFAGTHPHKLNDSMALIHNGIISSYGSKDVSDTVDFIDKVIGKISKKQWKSPAFRELVSDAIGTSKFVILDDKDNYYIINEDKGYWDDGIWYSNKSYIDYRKTYNKYESNYGKYKVNPIVYSEIYAGFILACNVCEMENDVSKWQFERMTNEPLTCGHDNYNIVGQIDNFVRTYFEKEICFKDIKKVRVNTTTNQLTILK